MKNGKLTLKEKWMIFWGLSYKLNFRSREIHRLKCKHISCQTHRISNGKFITERKALILLEKGYNGCYYCWKEKDVKNLKYKSW